MSFQPITELLGRLPRRIVEFRHHWFCLGDDLDRLNRVSAVGATEAAVLYCTRILEVLTAVALEEARLPTVEVVATDIDTLFKSGLLPGTTHYWAHALRRIGNDARHIRQPVQPEHMHTALVFIERWLHWYFCRMLTPNPLSDLTLDQKPLWSLDLELHALVAEAERVNFDADAVLAHVGTGAQQAVWLRSSALPAALADQLLAKKRLGEAWQVLEPALRRFRHDLRLRQLEGLYLSRLGQFDHAQELLESLRGWRARDSEDYETCGILGGIYKRKWDDSKVASWLERSHDTYTRGWKNSRETNTYLGINSATTALWLNRLDRVQPIASKVRKILEQREQALVVLGGPPRWVLGLWDAVTLGEALLLHGDKPEARRRYLEAFQREPEEQGSIGVARDQAIKILQAMGDPNAKSFLT
jgi:tetratricopeptide (TPR) repeat protein